MRNCFAPLPPLSACLPACLPACCAAAAPASVTTAAAAAAAAAAAFLAYVLCSMKKFSFTLKKMGCRYCGAVVCRNCTKKKAIKKYGLDREQVVCDQCARYLGSSYSMR